MASYLGRGNLDDSLFLGGKLYYHGEWVHWFGGGGGGGGELPLHLPWINPSARQLYAMTIIMCMLSL